MPRMFAMLINSLIQRVPKLLILVLAITIYSGIFQSSIGQESNAEGKPYYLLAGSGTGGDGSRANPFNTLFQAQNASASGDIIYLLSNSNDEVLDGGITLKPRQKLIGLGSDGLPALNVEDRVRLTNSGNVLDGIIVNLSDQNEVSGINFINMKNHAISNSRSNFKGTYIHDSSFSGNASVHKEDERGLIYAISLEADSGDQKGVRIERSTFSNGVDLGGIKIVHNGNATGNYHFQSNDFSDLGGRPYFILSRESSRIETSIIDSSVDNIGVGDRNSDSIIPYMMGRSEQVMLVRNFRYQNTNQEGNRSNTALEVFIFGEPRDDEANWCTGCKLTLKIIDSEFINPVTDGIQLTNYGINTEMNIEIRNTKIIDANPQQVGGAISLMPENRPNSGSRITLMVEDTDIINSTGYGFAMADRGLGYSSVIDFGGGSLGSQGNNRFINSNKGAMRVPQKRITAKHNWWNNKTPVIHMATEDGESSPRVEIEPVLKNSPR